MNRRDTIYSHFPPAPAFNYELDPERGYLSVILPEATTNLVTNPSVEIDLTGYTQHGGAALAQVFTWQAYGAAGISVTPAVSAESGLYFGTVSLTSGTTYTASITVQGEEGRKYFVWFATTAGALIGAKRTWIGTGRKQRIHVTYTETSSTTRRVYVTRDAYVDQHVWYADGLQVEAKAYPTTYCDGDQKGFVINQAAYLWTGTPHVSTSTRSAQTRAGGREVSLLSLGFRILSIIGLGMAPLVDQSLAIPGQGELYQGTGTTAREFYLHGSIFADGPGPRHLQDIRDGLIDAFKPDLTSFQQPLLLRYQALDENGDPCSDTLDLVCTYQGALEGNWTNHQREDIALQFKMHLPMIMNSYSSGTQLGFLTNVANFTEIGYRDVDGNWHAMGTGLSETAQDLVIGNDGYLYAVGGFASAGGVANTNYIAKWNGSAWVEVGGGITDTTGVTEAVAIAKGPDGSLYVGGLFANQFDANGDNISKWNGAAWSSLGTGTNGAVRDLVIAPDGSLYATGDFLLAGGVANTIRIAKWNGTVWSPLGSGLNTSGNALVIAPDGTLYAGGAFATAGGVTVNKIAKWNGTVWSPLGTGANGDVYTLAIGPDGSLYAGGIFTSMGGIANTIGIAKWNGTSWSSVGGGIGSGSVLDLYFDQHGNLYASGTFGSIGGISLPDHVAMLNGSTWIPLDVYTTNAASNMFAVMTDNSGQLYLSGGWGAVTAQSATVSLTNLSGARAYPTIIFTGPGTMWQVKNYTTGKAIYFRALTLLAGETATLVLDPQNISFTSSFRGNLMGYILAGSDLDWYLIGGSNDVSTYMLGTTAASKIVMSWKDLYWSLDGAVVK